MKHFIDYWRGHCVFTSMTHFFHICCHINLVWLLRVGVRLWLIISKLFWMSIPIGWCFRWTLWTSLTPFHIRPFSKSFGQQEASYHNFPPFVHVFNYALKSPFFFIIIPLQDICFSSFCLLACTKAICLWSPFLFLPTFMFSLVPFRLPSYVLPFFWFLLPSKWH